MPKIGSETKAEIEAFEAKLEATAAEKQEEQAASQAAARNANAEASEAEDMQDMETGRTCIWIIMCFRALRFQAECFETLLHLTLNVC